MRIIAMLLVIALVAPLMGCDSLTLKDPETEALEEQLAAAQKENEELRFKLESAKVVVKQLELDKITLKEDIKSLEKETKVLYGLLDSWVEDYNSRVENSNVRKTFTIKFDNNQLYNRADSREVAKVIAGLVKENGTDRVRILVKGYSSHNGDADYNMWLSKERAEGVMHKIYEATNDASTHVDLVAFGEGAADERKVVVEVEVF